MIHYHGLPITPDTVACRAVGGGHAFVSFAHPGQLGLALAICQTVALDNGAFSAWTSGKPITDWSRYYTWVAELHRYPVFDFACIPDVIDGDESANDALLNEWPWAKTKPWVGAPVWHMHESLERLERLAFTWPRICIGSSGAFAKVGSHDWYVRMIEVMNILCDQDGRPVCKIHGLRMLNPDVFTRFPFSSVDSTNIGRNVGIDNNWKRGNYPAATKEARAQIMRERIEIHQPPTLWSPAALFDKIPGLEFV